MRTYASFAREIERLLLTGETAIVMGSETVVPSSRSPDVGQTIRRRFTNVWMMRGGRWLLVAHHANDICQSRAMSRVRWFRWVRAQETWQARRNACGGDLD